MKKGRYGRFWEDTVGYHYEKELLEYKQLCNGHRGNKHKCKKLNIKRFYFYRDWEASIYERYKKFDIRTLKEFSHYLKLNSNFNITLEDLIKIFIVPTIVAVIATGLNDFITIDIFKILKLRYEVSILWNIVVNVIYLIFNAGAVMIFIVTPIYLIIKEVATFLNESNIEKRFIEDYIKIINNIILENQLS